FSVDQPGFHVAGGCGCVFGFGKQVDIEDAGAAAELQVAGVAFGAVEAGRAEQGEEGIGGLAQNGGRAACCGGGFRGRGGCVFARLRGGGGRGGRSVFRGGGGAGGQQRQQRQPVRFAHGWEVSGGGRSPRALWKAWVAMAAPISGANRLRMGTRNSSAVISPTCRIGQPLRVRKSSRALASMWRMVTISIMSRPSSALLIAMNRMNGPIAVNSRKM